MTSFPTVCAVVPAHARPDELRKAIASIRSQDYPGGLSTLVVFDRSEPDYSLQCGGERPVKVLTNERTPGLAGARNTGILAADAEWIAFCDDDDVWHHPRKLREQMTVAPSAAHLVTCAILVEYEGRTVERLAGMDLVPHEALVRSRMYTLGSSTFVFRSSSLLGELGLINEEIPGSHNEDWDILLRASALAPITHVDRPLVTILRWRSSNFTRSWDTKIASFEWMLEHHPDIAANRRAAGRVMGQIAFSYACSGERREAWRWATRALRRDPRQWRSPLASAVAVYPRSGEWALNAAHHFGRSV